MVKSKKPTTTVSATNTLVVRMRDLVSGERAMIALSMRPLHGGVSIKVARAMRKARNAITDYREAETAILKANGGVPSDLGGFELNKKAAGYEKAWKLLEEHKEGALDEEIELTGVKQIKLDQLMAAIPNPKMECPKCERKMDYIDEENEEKSIEPFILAELDWLIIE